MSLAAVVLCGGVTSSVLTLDRHARAVDALVDRHDECVVLAADQGLRLAASLGLSVDHLVGDMDSVDSAARKEAEAAGVQVHTAPRAKDATDLALALRLAHELGAAEIAVCDGGGDRGDHALANVLTVAGWAGRLSATLTTSTSTVTPIVDARTLDGAVGSVVTLLAVFGPVRGVRTTGLLYPLSGEVLSPGSSRGVSNEFVSPQARVSVHAGTLLAVQPVETS